MLIQIKLLMFVVFLFTVLNTSMLIHLVVKEKSENVE